MTRSWTYALAGLLVLGAASAHADLLELSGFGGYTTLGMKQVNSMLAGPKSAAGYDQTTTDDVDDGWLAGLDLRTGALIPVPFLSLGLKAEYVGANPGEAAGTLAGERYEYQEDPSLLAGMLGLDFEIGIPATPLRVGVSAYGGYGEGLIRQSYALAGSPTLSDLYDGGGFVGELEGRLDWKLYSVLHLYGFGGWRSASFGTFSDPAGDKLQLVGVPGGSSPKVDFSGATGGAGVTLDF